MKIAFRDAIASDIAFLDDLEKNCFQVFQQNSRRAIQYSVSSPFQKVLIAEETTGKTKVGSATLFLYPKTLRIFSLAVLPHFQGKEFGKMLLDEIVRFAKSKGYFRISLEVRENDKRLAGLYENLGFKKTSHLPDYYKLGENGVRMVRKLEETNTKSSISNIIIVKNPRNWLLDIDGVEVVSSKRYITDPKLQALKNVRIFNLSNSYQYQKMGYYVSLLASAREHRVIPNVTTLRDFSSLQLIRTLSEQIDDDIQKTLQQVQENKVSLYIYFGKSVNPFYRSLAQKLYQLFEAPLLQIDFAKTDKWLVQRVSPLSMKRVNPEHMDKVQEYAQEYFSKKRFHRPRFKNYKYDLAILVNPEEKNPPSCHEALKKFKKIAEKNGFYCNLITKDDFSQLSEYDALFIRETTSVNNYTYQFSRTAYAEGLVVIDDPWSILRCSNKIFQNEILKQNRIKTPATVVMAKSVYKSRSPVNLNFPLVLKQPDSAFSLGVTKVKNHEELDGSLKKLFKTSDLIIAQEFLPSEFDWRIGILDQKPLYACKYFMAKGHWQIYNWASKKKENWGNSETVAIEQVPEAVVKTALKAAALIGDGLYGVDLKHINDEVFIIEINDNPNIDYGIEDHYLKDELYNRVMQSIFNRIEINRNIAQFVTR